MLLLIVSRNVKSNTQSLTCQLMLCFVFADSVVVIIVICYIYRYWLLHGLQLSSWSLSRVYVSDINMSWGGVIVQLSIIIGCIAIFWTYPAFREQKETLISLFSTCPLHWFHDGDGKGSADANNVIRRGSDRILAHDELQLYDGSEGSKGLYVAVLGSVYDVSTGKKHYGLGGSYSFFSGVNSLLMETINCFRAWKCSKTLHWKKKSNRFIIYFFQK